eukprot:1237287-Pleurochrysis_carterae.AAC.3
MHEAPTYVSRCKYTSYVPFLQDIHLYTSVENRREDCASVNDRARDTARLRFDVRARVRMKSMGAAGVVVQLQSTGWLVSLCRAWIQNVRVNRWC